jgi:signal transduction histidine kinase
VSSSRVGDAVPVEAPGRRGLWLGVLAYRWAAYAWMVLLAFLSRGHLRYPLLAWTVILVAGAWSAWLTATRGWERAAVRWLDLAISAGLLLVSGLVMQERGVVGGLPFFATSYPVSSAMTIGAASGVVAGLWSGLVLSIALTLSRPLNGIPFDDLTAGQWTAIGNGAAYYLSAGGAVGLVNLLMSRSAAELRRASDETARERDRAVRLAEREALGREIHDSVLQALAVVTKRGRELSAQPVVRGEEIRRLADLASQQERSLRALIQRPPDEPPDGTVALRTILEAAAFGVRDVPVSVTTVDPIWLASSSVDELSAAVRQALDNVARHARASSATVFAEAEDGDIVITVRDDGAGFVYDEALLRHEGKLGLLGSMKGRIEDLGGSMRVASAPGKGTEVEFRLPALTETAR